MGTKQLLHTIQSLLWRNGALKSDLTYFKNIIEHCYKKEFNVGVALMIAKPGYNYLITLHNSVDCNRKIVLFILWNIIIM